MVNFVKNLFSKSKQGIGVELCPDRINLIQLQKQRQGYKVVTFVTEEVPEGVIEDGQILDLPTMAELLEGIILEHKIKAKHIATAIPGRESIVRLIPVPAELSDDNDLREYVNQEAGLYLPFPRDEADVDFQKLGSFVDEEGAERNQLLFVATRKDVTDSYITVFKEAGLNLDVVEVSSFSILRCIRERLQQFTPSEAAVTADIEFDSTEIAVIVDGVPQFSRTIGIGSFQIQSALSQAMNLPPSRNTELLQGMTLPVNTGDNLTMGTMGGNNPGTTAMMKVLGELADEIRRSIDFYLNQSDGLEVAQLFLVGPGSSIGQLDEFFMQRLSVPTEQIDPVAALGLEMDEEEVPPVQRLGLGVILGLGLREV
ncbi:MAG: type IV pilus assembly protein PilM [Cyanobacteria bacterium SID2]|nr:type IV pilus assembly protein PilM [Cyanobacteria bacterium SID2]